MRKTPVLLAAGLAVVSAGCYRDFDFTSDNKADFAVVDGNGVWKDEGAGTTLMTGSAGDIPVPGDWDGNNFWDKAVVKPDGSWVTGSSRGTIVYPAPADNPAYDAHFSLTVLPVPLDYDGDGDLEPAWFRESDATWFIQGYAPIQFGVGPSDVPGAGTDITINDYDMPVPADYDGDGKDDLSVFNPRSSSWRVRQSSDNVETDVTMGGNEVLPLPAPADYDGVGHAQRAVFGPFGWFIEGHDQPDLFGAQSEGETGLPAVADYDGNGTVDLSYVGTDTGTWYTQGSATTPTVDIVGGEYAVPTGANLMHNLERLHRLGFCYEFPDTCIPSGG